MSHLIRLVTSLLLSLALALPVSVMAQPDDPLPPGDGERAVVLNVIDGGTIRVEREDGSVENVRYLGVDVPRIADDEAAAEPFGLRATIANSSFVDGQEVILERDANDRDERDRLLRYVWVETEDGWVMVNERLVALGLADVDADDPSTRHLDYLRESEEQARFTGRGMHAADAVANELVGAEAMAYLFIDAYDARDAATVRQLLSRDVVYTLPGDARWRGKKDVIARFREEWTELEPDVTIRGSIAQPDAAVLELTITRLGGDDPGTIEAIGVQRWVDDRLVDYRIYRDE